MKNYLLAIAIIIPTISLTYNTMKVVDVDNKMDKLITSHQEVTDEFFSTAEALEHRITQNTTAINELKETLHTLEEDF